MLLNPKLRRRNPERFAHTVADKMLVYALGRGTEYYAGPAIRKIARDAAKGKPIKGNKNFGSS